MEKEKGGGPLIETSGGKSSAGTSRRLKLRRGTLTFPLLQLRRTERKKNFLTEVRRTIAGKTLSAGGAYVWRP